MCRLSLFLAVVSAAAALADEPEFDRKPLSAWTRQLGAGSVAERREAAGALRYFGPSALPALDALVAALKDTDAQVRENAADALWRIGTEARAKAVPALMPLLADKASAVRYVAAVAVWRLSGRSERVVPVLGALLERDNPSRLRAAWTLGEIGPEAKATLPALTALLRDADPHARIHAAFALWQVGMQSKQGVAVLIEALKSDDYHVRRSAAHTLRHFGPAGRDAIPELVRASDDPDPGLRALAEAALERVRPPRKEATREIAVRKQ